jgi:hypothetical protein
MALLSGTFVLIVRFERGGMMNQSLRHIIVRLGIVVGMVVTLCLASAAPSDFHPNAPAPIPTATP